MSESFILKVMRVRWIWGSGGRRGHEGVVYWWCSTLYMKYESRKLLFFLLEYMVAYFNVDILNYVLEGVSGMMVCIIFGDFSKSVIPTRLILP